jgi:hypothetical protein
MFMFVALIPALLITGVTECTARYTVANMNLGHEATEILGVIGQVVEIGGIEMEYLPRLILRGIAGIQNHIE